MILYPAIDLKDGMTVRLLRGEMGSATIFNKDPVDQAVTFQEAGFEWLHIVDLNGAVSGRPVNHDVVRAIISAVGLPIQLGGGIRDLATITTWIEAGVERVILGTAAVKQPDLVAAACRDFPGKIAVGIDARNGYVAVEGWQETSGTSAVDLARRCEDTGVATIIHTDIDRDGALKGLNLQASAELAAAVSLPIIASGGLASLDDIAQALLLQEKGIAGVVCGRALYDGRVDPAAALSLVASAEPI